MQHSIMILLQIIIGFVAVAVMYRHKIWTFGFPFATAQATAIANIYEPAIWEKYFIELTLAKSLLIRSGIAAATPEVTDAAMQGGRTVSMPFWEDLPNDTGATTRSKVATDDNTSITAAGVTTAKDIAYKHFRTQDFQVAPVVKYVAGSDPAQLIVSRYAEWWVREEQRILLQIMAGIFANATVATNLQNDISVDAPSTDAGNLIGSTAIENTRFLLGDRYDRLTAIIMHSTPFKRLRQLDLIDFVPRSAQDPMGGSDPYYMGLRVLVDDYLTVIATVATPGGFKYKTLLFGQGAIARVDVPLESGDPNIELWRQPLLGTGAGQLDIITRRYFILHPRGIAFSGTPAGVSPTDAELATGTNWTQEYQTKNIRIAQLITNG